MIDNWPRWIQFGIYSVASAVILGVAGELLKFTSIGTVLQLGALSPTLLTIAQDLSVINLILLTAGCWFLLGAILGKFVDKSYIAALIWITILVSGSWTSYLLLNNI
ncbi:MAG: hypothetical protein IMY76_09040 [Chloroflexi bacterium]|nr:hypothetical protein [Chloroflexota bacterium]